MLHVDFELRTSLLKIAGDGKETDKCLFLVDVKIEIGKTETGSTTGKTHLMPSENRGVREGRDEEMSWVWYENKKNEEKERRNHS